MDNNILVYGTPLNKVLGDDLTQNDFNRRTRINSGRQRFHGAFTGGFSAGYYNTVDTAEGFQPKTFISHRRNRDDEGQRHSHKPEDYMDEEDFGEFGIAPKKIRITSQFIRSDKYSTRSKEFVPKNDFHGLGYKPLQFGQINPHTSSGPFINPLTAVLKAGKRLKISGEAFGSGVLDEDDEDCIELDTALGYDDIRNYEFRSNIAPSSKHLAKSVNEFSGPNAYNSESDLVPGFVPAQKQNNLDVWDNFDDKYPPLDIPRDWKMPSEDNSIFLQISPEEASQKLVFQGHRSSSVFQKKFAASTDSVKSDIFDAKAGLVHYSDLKTTKPSIVQGDVEGICKGPDSERATILRKNLEWRPCGILCKRFNVPNPYPDNSFFGTKIEKVIKQDNLSEVEFDTLKETYQEPASYELKRAIFNVIFEDQNWQIDKEYRVDENEIATEDENDPQVVLEFTSRKQEDTNNIQNVHEGSAEDLDIIVVPAPEPMKPEVIELLSSSSSSPPQPDESVREHWEKEKDDIDIYGPPLPPTLKSSSDSDHRQSSKHRRSSKQRKKSKKHKKKKRD